MKRIIVSCLLVALGLIIGLVVAPSSSDYYYETTTPLLLLEDGVVPVARIPAGTPLRAEGKLRDTLDFAWWAYVPVYFETQAHAVKLGIVAGSEPDSVFFRLSAEEYQPGLLPIREPEPVVSTTP